MRFLHGLIMAWLAAGVAIAGESGAAEKVRPARRAGSLAEGWLARMRLGQEGMPQVGLPGGVLQGATSPKPPAPGGGDARVPGPAPVPEAPPAPEPAPAPEAPPAPETSDTPEEPPPTPAEEEWDRPTGGRADDLTGGAGDINAPYHGCR